MKHHHETTYMLGKGATPRQYPDYFEKNKNTVAEYHKNNDSEVEVEIKKCNLHNSRIFGIVTILSGSIFIVVGIFISGLLSATFESSINNVLIINSVNSPGYNNFISNNKTGDVPSYKSFYLYNITNEDQFMKGGKLNVQEVGPFIYRQYFYHFDVSFYDGKLSYNTQTWYTFVSAPDGIDMNLNNSLTIVNFPSQLVIGKFNNSVRDFFYFNFINNKSQLQLQKLFISQALWGFYSSIFKASNSDTVTINPMYGGFGGNQTEVNPDLLNDVVWTGETDMNLIQSYYKFQDSTTLDLCLTPKCPPNAKTIPWASTEANLIRGSTGKQFPRYVKPNDQLQFYYPYFLRLVNLVFIKSFNTHNIDVLRFHVDESPYQNTSVVPENSVFYNFGPAGVVNLSAALNNCPLFISKPRFLDADPIYRDSISGVPDGTPNRDSLESFFDVEPITGTVVAGKVRVQSNIIVRPLIFPTITYFNVTPTMIPIYWTEEGGEVTDELGKQLSDALTLGKKSITYSFYIGVSLGVLCIVAGIIIVIRAYYYRAALGLPFFSWSVLPPENPEAFGLMDDGNSNLAGGDAASPTSSTY